MFDRLYKQERMGIKFEYTAPHTSQQNGRVEQVLTMLHNSVQAMLKSGNFPCFLKNDL